MEKILTLKLNWSKLKTNFWLKTNKTQKIIISIFGSVVIFLTFTSLLFWGYQSVYADKFYVGIKINNNDIGGKTKTQAKTNLKEQAEELKNKSYNIDVDGEIKQTTLADLGADFDIDKSMEIAYEYGRSNSYVINCWQEFIAVFNEKEFDLIITYNQEDLEKKLKEIAGDVTKEASNSTISVSSNNLTVISEEWGKQVNVDIFKSDLENIISYQNHSDISLKFQDIEPEIKSWQVEEIKDEVERIVFPDVVLLDSENGKGYTASSKEIATWILLKASHDKSLAIEFSNENISDYIQSIAYKTDIKLINRKVNQVTGELVVEGQDSRTLNQDKAKSDILAILVDRKIYKNTDNVISLAVSAKERGEEQVFVFDGNYSGGTPGLMDGKYIEISLAEQAMYLYNGDNLEGTYQISSGKASMPTPTGTRYVGSKSTRAWSATYKLYMPYWMSIGGDYGIHELPEWPNGYKEGEAHLGTPVSHGCIRLGIGAAETVYNWTPSGTPVVIHN